MKLLLVAFEFPPLATAGVYRPMKLAQYLVEHGIDPVIVTTDVDSLRRTVAAGSDESLLSGFPTSIPIERIPCADLPVNAKTRLGQWRRIFFSLVEPQAKVWAPVLDVELPRIIETHAPAMVLVTLPPFGMAPLWCKLTARFNLPLVLDFRDAWSQWRIAPYASRIHYALTLRLEGAALRQARRIICSSDQIRADLLSIHPGLDASKLATITNGHERESKEWSVTGYMPVAEAPFVFGYVGSFYYEPTARASMLTPWWRKRPNRMIQFTPRREDWLYRSPFFFFRALAKLFERFPELRARVRVRLAGRKPQWLQGQLREFELETVVEHVGTIPHDQVEQFERSCNALLLTSSKVIGGRDYSIAGKTFEYFAQERPIVGFVCAGAQRDELEKSGMAVLCDPDDPDASSEKLAALINGNVTLVPNVEYLNSRHRRELARELAKILKDAL